MRLMKQKMDYRQVLREEYELRCRRNARYSLRSFARDLHLAPSRVSDIFNNGRGISPKKAQSVAEHLGYSAAEQSDFVMKVQVAHARSPRKRAEANEKLKELLAKKPVLQISLDNFSLISGWHHLAILELTSLKDFKSDVSWIARRLNLTPSEVKISIDRLIRLNLLCEVNGQWQAVDDKTNTPNDIPSKAIKEFHSGILKKASSAVYSQNTETRDLGATVVGINIEDIPKAKALIRNFRAEMAKLLESNKEKNAVYCLSTQFFKLDQEKE
jgi:uncharacterized protein (TIGR02147 family)